MFVCTDPNADGQAKLRAFGKSRSILRINMKPASDSVLKKFAANCFRLGRLHGHLRGTSRTQRDRVVEDCVEASQGSFLATATAVVQHGIRFVGDDDECLDRDRTTDVLGMCRSVLTGKRTLDDDEWTITHLHNSIPSGGLDFIQENYPRATRTIKDAFKSALLLSDADMENPILRGTRMQPQQDQLAEQFARSIGSTIRRGFERKGNQAPPSLRRLNFPGLWSTQASHSGTRRRTGVLKRMVLETARKSRALIEFEREEAARREDEHQRKVWLAEAERPTLSLVPSRAWNQSESTELGIMATICAKAIGTVTKTIRDESTELGRRYAAIKGKKKREEFSQRAIVRTLQRFGVSLIRSDNIPRDTKEMQVLPKGPQKEVWKTLADLPKRFS